MAGVVATTKYSVLADNSITVSLPSGILANDIIDAVVSVRRTGANPTISGYTQISTTSNTFETRRLAKVAAGGETSFATGNSGTSVSGALWLVQVRIIRFADITGGIAAAYDGTNVGTATATSIASPALTTTADDDLILHDCVFDTVVPVPSSVSALNILMGMGNMAGGVYQQGAHGAVPTFNWLSNASKAASAHVAAVKNAASGTKDIFLVDNRVVVRNYAGYETPTFAVPSSVIATIGSYETSSGAITPTSGTPTASDWIIPGYSIASTENISGASKWVGVWDTNPTLSNIEGKNVVIPFGFSTTVDSTRIDADGFIVVFADTSNRIAAYQLLAQKDMVANTALTKFIKPGTTTPYATSGTIDWTDSLKVGYFYLRKTGTTTSVTVVIGRISYESAASQIVGGGVDFPITAKQVALRMLAGGFYSKAATFNGAGQLISKLSVEYGNGATPTYVKHSGDSIEYPNASDIDWLLGDSAASINYKWSSSDTTILSGSIHRTTRRAGFSIDAAASASASVNLVNASFFGPWDFADNLGKDFTGALFNGCYRVTLNNGTYTNLTVENTADTVAVSAAASGATISGSTIDGTGAAYALELGTAVTAITLTDVTFTGTPGTTKVHALGTSGTLTITISGITPLVDADITRDVGLTVIISAPTLNQSVSLTSLSTTCRVQLYDNSVAAPVGSRILYNGEPGTTSFTWTDAAVAIATRDIRIRITDYLGATAKLMVERNIGTCGITEGTAAISFNNEAEEDTSYNAQAAALGYTGADITDIEIDDSTNTVKFNFLAGGDYDARRIYMYMVYWLDTEAGIADDFVFCSPLDPVNLPMTGVLFENVTSPQEIITFINAYVYDATTGRAKDLIVGDGINFAPDHVVQVIATVGGVNIITGDIGDVPTAAEIAAEVAANPETVTVSTLLALQQE